jgi:hypothetical protein
MDIYSHFCICASWWDCTTEIRGQGKTKIKNDVFNLSWINVIIFVVHISLLLLRLTARVTCAGAGTAKPSNWENAQA